MKIIDLNALQVLDSRGNPTLQVDLMLEDGSKGSFQVPSGASTGIHEAIELRDKNFNVYHGKGVLKAVENVKEISKFVYDKEFDQESLDNLLLELDGTNNKSVLGANAILGVSVAFAKSCAKHYGLPLYDYLMRITNSQNLTNRKISKPNDVHLFANILNGGLHAGNALKIQEFMIIATQSTLSERVRAISEIYQTLKEIISKEYGKESTSVGDEGGFAPNIKSSKEALDLIMSAIKQSSYEGEIFIALDAAASDFYSTETKLYEVEEGLFLDYKKLTDYYNNLLQNYPIISIEDPMAEDDFKGFEYLRAKLSKLTFKNIFTNNKEVLIVGDDLLVTNPNRISIAIDKKLCNSLLLKINQIGTLSEALQAYKMANSKGWHVIVSHRSGETCDDFISDLSVALNSSIKIGAPARGERVAKYNRLLNIFS